MADRIRRTFLGLVVLGCAAAGRTVAECVDIGSLPPDYTEQGIAVAYDVPACRSFSLTAPRRLRIETVADPDPTFQRVELIATGLGRVNLGSDLAPVATPQILETRCLAPHAYSIEIESPGDARIGLTVSDLGSCIQPNDLVVAISRLRDLDGDRDGYPDPGETVELFLSISNKTAEAFSNLALRVLPEDGKLIGLPPAVLAVGTLPANSDAEVATPIVFRVSPLAERAGPMVACAAGACSNLVVRYGYHLFPDPCASAADCIRAADDEYHAGLLVEVPGDSFVDSGGAKPLRLELDLDSTHPAVPTTTFSESFESGFGAFTYQNLDANKASNSASNGYRCQYNDPDFPASGSYNEVDCWLGFVGGQSPTNDWHIHFTAAPDGGRAFDGIRSLHYGKHTPGETTSMSQLDGLRSRVSIPLAARTCRDDPGPNRLACAADADCLAVGGGPCVPARPILSFKQQVSTMDSRASNTPLGEAADRAVVHARPAGGAVWRKIYPFENLYDVQATDVFANCMFDPIDDGHDEDAWFPGHSFTGEPHGPSSTCMPEFVFSYLGDTDEPYEPSRIGRASDGPGLQGSLGIGTWVESRFDLSQLRGRSIELRFLYTSIRISEECQSFEECFTATPADDGWYVDDVRLSETLGTSLPTAGSDAAASPPQSPDADGDGIADAWDACPNSSDPAQRDADRDAIGDACDGDINGDGAANGSDCAPMDGTAWVAPSEPLALRFATKSILTWQAPASPGGTAPVYDMVRSPDAAVFNEPPAETIATGLLGNAFGDHYTIPNAGSAFFYLIRSRNTCQ